MAGSHLNISGNLSSSAGSSSTSSDTLTVLANPGFSKAFTPALVSIGETSTLSFTIDNAANSVALGALAFTDSLPTGMTVASSPAESNGCGGSLSALADSDSVSLVGGTVSAGGSCTIDVDVVSTASGDLLNTTGTLSSDAGTGSTASDTLTVLAPVGFTSIFGSTPIPIGQISTLSYSIDNSGNGISVASLSFLENLPNGLVVADPANASSDCGGSFGATIGSGIVSLSGGSVAAGSSCSMQVDLRADIVGSYGTGTTLSSEYFASGETAAATLDVEADGCSLGVLTISDITFTGTHVLRSEVAILTSGSVIVDTGADVTFEAPTIGLDEGFVVENDALFEANDLAVSCAGRESDRGGSPRRNQ